MPDAGQPPRSFDRSIVEGPLPRVVWMLAWPTMLQNMFGGLQGIVDHIMVGHFVGYTGNAAIGVSWQIFLVVVVFVSSLFTGTAVLVARFAGAGNRDMVNRTVYQAFITALALSILVAPAGYILAPKLLDVVNAAPDVKVQALPYLRIMFVFSLGMMLFFMLGVALRSAGDARTPLRLGIWLTLLNIALNTMLISGLGPFPRLGTAGAAVGTVISGATVSGIAVYLLWSGRLVIHFHRGMGWKPDWQIIRELFRFGVPSGFQAVAMNVAGVFLLRFVGSLPESAQAQAAYAVAYTELFSLVTWTSQGLLGATAAVAGQNLGAGKPDRSARTAAVASRIGLGVAAVVGVMFLTIPRALLAVFGMHDPAVVRLGTQLMTFLSVSGLFISVALAYTGGLQGTGDTKSPFYISVISQMVIPLGLCAVLQATRGLHAGDIWLAIVLGHATRCALSVGRFRQGKWRDIAVNLEPARP